MLGSVLWVAQAWGHLYHLWRPGLTLYQGGALLAGIPLSSDCAALRYGGPPTGYLFIVKHCVACNV